MKTKLYGLAALLVAFLAASNFVLLRQVRSAREHLAETERQLLAETQARADQESRSKALERSQAGLSEQLVQLSGLAATLRASAATNASNYSRLLKAAKPTVAAKQGEDSEEGGFFGGKGFGATLSKMMNDPAMKEMMRSQQKIMVNKMYGPLLKDLNLTGDRKEKLMAALLEQQMKTVDKAGDFFDKEGKFDSAKISEAAKQGETEGKEAIKATLSEQEFAYYEDYKKTMSDRMQLEQLRTELDGTTSPLKDEQLRQLLAVLADERQKNPPEISQDPGSAAANLEKIFAGDSLEKQMQWQEQMNQRVLDRVGQILDAEQLKAYADFQSQQLNMQKLGLKMMQGMFGKKSSDAVAPPNERSKQ